MPQVITGSSRIVLRIFGVAAAMVTAVPCAAVTGHPAAAFRRVVEGSPIVIGRSFKIASSSLHGSRTINVYLPAGYDKSTARMPALFLLDGGEHEDFLHIAGMAQITAANGEGQEMIVVGIAGIDRRHDLTTSSSVPADLKAAPTSGGALASAPRAAAVRARKSRS